MNIGVNQLALVTDHAVGRSVHGLLVTTSWHLSRNHTVARSVHELIGDVMLEFLSQAMSGSVAATWRLSMGRLTSRANAVYRAIVSLRPGRGRAGSLQTEG